MSLEDFLAEEINRGTCPRCDLWSLDAWCCLCGDSYPWPKKDEPLSWAEPKGIQ